MAEITAYAAAVEAFQRAYEAEHPDERTAFFAGIEAAEPFMAGAVEELRARGGLTPRLTASGEPF